MSKIKILPIHLVNKIAAGECIERPASVIKELVENSIDAGATRIEVTLEQGGTKLIRITDNGGGIGPDELELSVTPHATSKLSDENDLYSVSSMGFRGEALSSIASVSMMKISSVFRETQLGGEIEIHGGEIKDKCPFAGATGTTIEVQNLFYNTPARRKFLKTSATELNHCQEYLIRLALAFPKIGFYLSHGNRSLLELPAVDNPRDRISGIFGPEISDGLIQVFTQTDEITLMGYVSRPESAKPSANWQYFFVNHRAIRDRYLGHALKEAYRGLMPQDRQPVAFLFLDINPALVDVNVHPTKSEVRFADSGAIHSLALGAIRDRFLSSDLSAPLSIGSAEESNAAPEKEKIKNALNDFLKSAKPAPAQMRIPFSASKTSSNYSHSAPLSPPRSDFPQPTSSYHHSPAPSKMTDADSPLQEENSSRVLQIHNAYLVVETDDGLMIIDQHALHERVLYQQLKSRIDEGQLERQNLLVPEVVNLTSSQMASLEECREELFRAGIDVKPFGPQSMAISSFPALLKHFRAQDFIEELLHRLDKTTHIEAETVLEHVLQSLACKAAVKAGDPLCPEEIQSLLTYHRNVELTGSCPHGRPTTLQMSLAELQKQFRRT
jgi:DNA mismatch repair protein MutL